jgi:hypothetical protein
MAAGAGWTIPFPRGENHHEEDDEGNRGKSKCRRRILCQHIYNAIDISVVDEEERQNKVEREASNLERRGAIKISPRSLAGADRQSMLIIAAAAAAGAVLLATLL